MNRRVITLLAFGLPALLAGQDLTQADAVRAALAANPRLEAARAAREAGGAQAEQARWDRYGRLDLGFQWNPSVGNPEFTLPTAPAMTITFPTYARNQFEASFTQPVWTWGALSGRARAAGLREEADLQLEIRTAQQIAFDATRAYLEAGQAQEAVAVAEQNLAQEQAFLANARARVAQGASARLDVLRAELSVSEAESGLIAARNQVLLTREALVTVTREDRFRTARLRFEQEQRALPDEAGAIARGLRRPDLLGSVRQAQALRTSAEAERAAGLPSLSIRTVLSQAGDTHGWGQAANRTYAVGLAIQWEALSARRARIRYADLSAQARSEQAQAASLEDRLVQDIRGARWRIEQAGAQIEVARRALAQAEEQARVSRLAYQEGIRTAVERQSDEVALSDARYRLLSTRLDLGLAWAALDLAVGD